jgi:hypothetical protein
MSLHVNVIAADSDKEAARLSFKRLFLGILTGNEQLKKSG